MAKLSMTPFRKMNVDHIKSLKSATKAHGKEVTRMALEHLREHAEQHAHKLIDSGANAVEKKVNEKLESSKAPEVVKKVAKRGVSEMKNKAAEVIKIGVSKKMKM